MLCVHQNYVASVGHSYVHPHAGEVPGGESYPDVIRYTHDDIIAAPIGSLQHRVCECPVIQHHRDRLGPTLMGRFQRGCIPEPIQEAFSTALFPLPRLVVHNTPPSDGSFDWVHNEGTGQFVKGRIYTDASRIDDDHPDALRLGWAFVVLDSLNHVTAVARGVPPHFVDDIPGAEAWALLQAATVALPGSTFYSDCKSCVDAVKAGRTAACGPHRPLARVYGMLFTQLDDVPVESVVWMPAHTAECKVGKTVLSNGALLTHPDRQANQRADTEAKAAARQYALSPDVIQDVQHKARVVLESAKWLGHATWLATHGQPPAPRDSEASKMAAKVARSNNFANGDTRPANLLARARKRTVRDKVTQWSRKAAAAAEADGNRPRHHQLIVSGRVLWCNTCGAYATGHAVRLARSCEGPVDIKAAGGRAQQLRKLREGKHPKTGHRIGDAVPWRRLNDEQRATFGSYESCDEPHDSDSLNNQRTTRKRSMPASGEGAFLSTTTFRQLQLRVRARQQAKRCRD